MQANLVAAMNGVDAMDIEFNVKMMLKLQPMKILGPSLFLNVMALASILVLFERPNPDANITSFPIAVYVVVLFFFLAFLYIEVHITYSQENKKMTQNENIGTYLWLR